MDHQQPLPLPLPLPPHVLIFPFPAQGHVNSMLKLAELFCLAGLHVTFLLTNHNHNRLVRYANLPSFFRRYPGFRFETISDGLPAENPRSSDKLMELLNSLEHKSKPLLKELLLSTHQGDRRPVTCIIADGVMGFAIEAAEEIGVPIIYFRTISACAFWAYFYIPDLIEAGELPFKGNDMEKIIERGVSGMEGVLRRCDLPSFCRVADMADPALRMIIDETQNTTRVQALILNTFEDLEGPILANIRTRCPKLYSIGPLHAHLKTRLAPETKSSLLSSNSLWEQDWSCMTWLDAQPLKSVIYVSFGSVTMTTKDQVMDFWHGLVNSGKRFLWVMRPDSVADKDWESHISAELRETTKERGYIVGWAPQEEVLAHQAVGGFFTHSGWNSTLESIVVGLPMICWPYFGDQQVNSRFVTEVWKLGLDMKDTCDRVIVEKMVNDLMEVRRDEFMISADQIGKLARESVSEGGSSYSNLDRLIDDIRLMIVEGKT